MSTRTNVATPKARLSPGIRFANRVIVALLRAGVPVGPMCVLTVPGRRSGQPRRTPVTPVELGGRRYLVQAFAQAGWVRNARAAGSGTLGRGRRQIPVRLVELGTDERRPILRELPRVAARAAGIYVRNGIVEAPTPDAFAAAAPRCAVFQVEA